MDSQSTPLRVLIIGSGSAGLLFAQVLKKRGIACTVFEQDKSFYERPRDWNFGIYWAQNGLGACLPEELKALLPTVQTDPKYVTDENTTMPVHNGLTGELLRPLPAPFGWRVKRKMWLQMISQGIDIKWGKRMKNIETSNNIVTVTFEDGTKESGNLLVGAEGAHSPTRTHLLGPTEAALLQSPIVASITITKIGRQASIDLRKLNTNHTISFHPNGTFTWMGVHDVTSEDPGEWTWMLIQTWRADEPTNLKEEDILPAMYERGKSFGYPFNEVFATIPAGTKVYHNRLSSWPTKPWEGNGIITLAGDSAHAMTFHRGQGVNNAITDASDFLTQLERMKEHTPEELMAAVKRYEAELFPRGNEAVVTSYNNTLAVHDWKTTMSSPLFTKGLAKIQTQAKDNAKVEVVEVAAPPANTNTPVAVN